MDYLLNIISYIRDKSLNQINKQILTEDIYQKFQFEIKQNELIEKDIFFLIDLINQNLNLTNELIRDIFLNSKNKIEHRILVSKGSNFSSLNNLSNINNYQNNILSIFSNFGYIFIKPKVVILLWNKKNALYEQEILSEDTFNKYSTDQDNQDDKILVIQKYINYDILNNIDASGEDIRINQIFDNYNRKYGLQQYITGFKTKYELIIPIENEFFFTSITEIYQGKILIDFKHKKYETQLTNAQDLKKILSFYLKDLSVFFSENPNFFWMYIKSFFMNGNLLDLNSFLLNSIKSKSTLHLKKPLIDKYIYIKPIEPNIDPADFLIKEICPHEELYKKILFEKENYFNNINEFINKYITYENGIALCQLCYEMIEDLNIRASLFIDGKKYITYTNDLLLYNPYNKFINVKYFFDNLFYLFNQHTKIHINDDLLIIRIVLDNFIFLSSKRLELEYKYKSEIENNNIFLLRLSNNFFDTNNEKEKYQDKKTVFTYIPIIIIILIIIPIHDYYDILFLRKNIKLTKFEDIYEIDLKDIIVLIIDFFLKKLKLDYYNESEQKRRQRIRKAVDIYLDIFNEEAQIIFENKNFLFKNFIQQRKFNLYQFEIPQFMDSIHIPQEFDNGHYLLDIRTIKNYYKPNYKDTLKITYNIFNKKIDVPEVIDYNVKKSYYDKNKNILFIDFKNITKNFNHHTLLNTLLKEFDLKQTFLLQNKKYKIIEQNNSVYLLYNEENKILFQESELSFLKTDDNSDAFSFFTYNDYFIFKKNISRLNFIDILEEYLLFLENMFNIEILSNITTEIYQNFQLTYDRSILFLIKIQIFYFIKEELHINYNIYHKFNTIFLNMHN